MPPDNSLGLTRLQELALAGNPTLPQASAEITRLRAIRAETLGLISPSSSNQSDLAAVVREAAGSVHTAKAQRSRILGAVTLAYYECLAVDEAAERFVDFANRAEQIHAAVLLLRQLGLRDRTDLPRSENERLRCELAIRATQVARLRVVQRLASLLGRESLPSSEFEGNLDADPPTPDRSSTWERIARESEELRVVRDAASEARALTVAAYASETSGGPKANEATSVYKARGKALAAQGETAAACREVRRVELSLRDRLERAITDRDTAILAASQDQKLAENEQRTFDSLFARYANPQTQSPPLFLDVQTAQRAWFHYRLAVIDARHRAWRASASIEHLLLADGLHPAPWGRRKGGSPLDLERQEAPLYSAASLLPA